MGSEDPRALFERICPRVLEHPRFGHVTWSRRYTAYVAYRKTPGQADNVPVLIRPLRRAAGSMSEAEEKALFDGAWAQLVALEERAPELCERGHAAHRDLVRAEGDDRYRHAAPARPGLSLGSVELHDDGASVVIWYFDELRMGASTAIWVDRGGGLRTQRREGDPPSAGKPIADWLVPLPAHAPHPILGDLVLNVELKQYLALRSGEEPPLVRVDLPAMEVAALPAHLEACAVVLGRIQSSFDESVARAEAMLEPWRAERGLPSLCRKREWVVFLNHGTTSLLLEDAMPPHESSDECFFNVALDFDSTGNLIEVKGTTAEETYSVGAPAPVGVPERVVHRKFGAGDVIAALEGDKVRVRFDDGTKRVLQRSFLTSG